MDTDHIHEDNSFIQKDIQLKIEKFCGQSQIFLNRLQLLKQELNEIYRLHRFDLYAPKLNEIGKIVQNLVQNIPHIEQLHLQLHEKVRLKFDRQIRFLRAEIDREASELRTLRTQARTTFIDEKLLPIDDTNNVEQDATPNELRQRYSTTKNESNDLYDSLETDLTDLYGTMNEIGQLVAQHQEKISNTEHSIHVAHDRIHNASALLQNAVHNRYVTLASGALLGASLGGPVGLMLGLKTGALAALSGSAVGLLSVNFLQRRKTQHDESKTNNVAYDRAML